MKKMVSINANVDPDSPVISAKSVEKKMFRNQCNYYKLAF